MYVEDRNADGDSTDYDRSTYEHGIEPYKDPEVLRRLYSEAELSQSDIADEFGITKQTVSYWMNKLDVDTRPPMDQRESKGLHRIVREDGYTQYVVSKGDGGKSHFYQHQLVALLEFGPHEVFDPDTHVHHELNAPVPIDLPANLDVIGDTEHALLHGGSYNPDVDGVLAAIFASSGSVEMSDGDSESESGTAVN
jgi:hypothetical protein